MLIISERQRFWVCNNVVVLCRSYWRSWWSIHSLCRTEAGLLAVPREPHSCTAWTAASSQRGMSAWLSPLRPTKPTGHTRVPAPGPIARSPPPGPPEEEEEEETPAEAARTGMRCHRHLHLPLSLTTHLLPCQPLLHHLLLPAQQSLPFRSSRVHASGAGLPRTPSLQLELMKVSWIYLMAQSWWSGSKEKKKKTWKCTCVHSHLHTHTHTHIGTYTPSLSLLHPLRQNNGETSRQGCREGIKKSIENTFYGCPHCCPKD